MGRRVKKTVYVYEASAFSLQSTYLYVYDGWNLIEELDDSQAVQKAYVWGLDLSQSIQGAGGVSGLLAVVDDAVTYQYLYDSNGNVGQVVDTTDGSVAAHYEYDPYGNLIDQVGVYAANNIFRFSTKYYDKESGLYYYGYRYYSASLGRWISKDPAGERGGENLYRFVNNNAINEFDLFGLAPHPGGVIPPGQAVNFVEKAEQRTLKLMKLHQDVYNRSASDLNSLYTSILLKELGRVTFDTNRIDGLNASGGVDNANKWIFTCKYGFVDVGHFFTMSYLTKVLHSPKFTYTGLSLIVMELGVQGIPELFGSDSSNAESSGTYEDLNSNYQGAHFNYGGIGNVASNFSGFLREAGAVNYSPGSRAERMIKIHAWLLLSGNNNELYSGKRIYSKSGQLKYQKEVFSLLFCTYCEGDSAKEEYKY